MLLKLGKSTKSSDLGLPMKNQEFTLRCVLGTRMEREVGSRIWEFRSSRPGIWRDLFGRREHVCRWNLKPRAWMRSLRDMCRGERTKNGDLGPLQ